MRRSSSLLPAKCELLMTLKTPARESIPPTLSPSEAIGLILRQLAQFEEIEKLHPEDPKAKKWHVTTEGILQAAFGKPDGKNHPNTAQFLSWAATVSIKLPASLLNAAGSCQLWRLLKS